MNLTFVRRVWIKQGTTFDPARIRKENMKSICSSESGLFFISRFSFRNLNHFEAINKKTLRNEYSKLKKERDYHKMHHLRLEQEKAKLVTSLKWTKNHYEAYPAALE